MPESVTVDVEDLTVRQMLRWLIRNQRTLTTTVHRMEALMADLTAAVTDLKSAIDGVAQRLLPKITALETALAAAQADDADATALIAEASAATADIRTEVDRLNALGTDPTTPVEEEPADPIEPPPVEVVSGPGPTE